ncbi:MAG: hypothetical protein M1831_004486 [Alyxoria varia]|nr:MAG: hypothetical protein M1831_004486 [Alyxoria varia]
MPTLKQLHCNIEHGSSNSKLPEFCTSYGDGFVETYVHVPSKPVPFSIHLTSEGYIASGLAMFVFIDGVAQCNRNRVGLIPPGKDTTRMDTQISFRVRQKEDRTNDDHFIGREWTFQNLNTALADAKSKAASDDYVKNVGTIEVIVRRCQMSEHEAAFNAPGSDDEPMHSRKLPKQTGTAKPSSNKDKRSSKMAPRSPVASIGGMFDGVYEEENDHGNDPSVMMRSLPQLDGGWDEEDKRSSPRESAKSAPGIGLADEVSINGLNRSGGIVINQYLSPEGEGRAQRRKYYDASVDTPPRSQLRNQGYGPPQGYSQRSAHFSSGEDGHGKSKGTKSKVNDNNWGNNHDGNNNWDHNADTGNAWNNDANDKQGWNTGGGDANRDGNAWDNDNGDNWGGDNNAGPAWVQDAGGADKQDVGDTGSKAWANSPAWNASADDKIQAWNADTIAKTSSRKSASKAPSEHSQKVEPGRSSKKPSHLEPKPYWNTWAEKASTSSRSEEKRPKHNERAFIASSEAPPKVPQKVAEKANMSHQVKAGKGALYHQDLGRPEYLDSMEKPYAVFTFRYRSKDMLKKMFGSVIREEKGEWQKRMMTLPKEELIEMLRVAKIPIVDAFAQKSAGYSTDSTIESDSEEEDTGKKEEPPAKSEVSGKKEPEPAKASKESSKKEKDHKSAKNKESSKKEDVKPAKDNKSSKKDEKSAKSKESSKKVAGAKAEEPKERKDSKSEKKSSEKKSSSKKAPDVPQAPVQISWQPSNSKMSIPSIKAPESRATSLILDPTYQPYLTLLKAFRNGLVYGTKVRFPHALVMVFLFRSGTLREKLTAILKATRQHAKNLAVFAFTYKGLMLLLRKFSELTAARGVAGAGKGKVGGREKGSDSFLAGLAAGYFVFARNAAARNSSVNQQIVIYVFARVILGLAKLLFLTPSHPSANTLQAGYGDVSPRGPGLLDAILSNLPIENAAKARGVGVEEFKEGVRKRIARDSWTVLAAGSWGAVMWLFRWYPGVLQPSLRSSMRYLYENAEGWEGWRTLVWHNR